MINKYNVPQEEKVFFSPGDIVTLDKDIPFKPTMLVVKKENSIIKYNKDQHELLKGIRCRWFTKDGFLQEAIFNTKDLILIK